MKKNIYTRKNFNKFQKFIGLKFYQNLFDSIKKPVVTEKTIRLSEKKQYIFDVDRLLTKIQIKKIFETYYGIQVKSIKTYNLAKKKKYAKQYYYKSKKRIIICCNASIPIFKNETIK